MEEHPNVALVRKYDEQMRDGNWEAMMDSVADDVEWHEIGRSEPTRGKQALAERMQNAFGDAQVTGETHDIVGNDDHVVMLVEATATRGNETFKYRTAEILHIRDGKLTARWAFSDDTARIMDFFGPG
jgi:ketosteroid isomerase-like protein